MILHCIYRKCIAWFILATCLLCLSAARLQAVVIAGPNPDATTSAPADDPGWSNVGTGPYSNVYLGNGWVLEAYHCHSLGGGNDYATINGVYYTGVAGSGIRLTDPNTHADTDLYLYRINGNPGLASLAISSTINSNYSSSTVMTGIGYGLDRLTGSTTWNSAWIEGGTPTMYSGYKLLTTHNTKRWGQNKYFQKIIVNAGYGDAHAIQLNFDQPGLPSSVGNYEFEAAMGDSGGGLFVKDANNVWNLAGILEAIGTLPNQPALTAVYGDTTYAIDLSFYRDQIVAAVQAFQFSGTLSNPTAAMGTGWQSVQLIGNGGFGSSTGTWSTPLDTNGFTFTVDSGASMVSISSAGVISGGGGLTKSGAGMLILSAADTFTGATNIAAGTLKLSNAGALQNSTLNYTAGTLVFDSGVASHAFALGGLSGSKAITLKDSANNPVALSLGGNGQDTSYSGALDGPGSLTKLGPGVLSLIGTLSYTGNTNVLDGTLNVLGINTPAATISVLGADTTLNAASITADTLNIGAGGAASGFISAFAAQHVSAVPEPGVLTLLLPGMLLLGAVRWLRRGR